jgi:prepilin-type N-terminal cleavage/methylation domain-containing protein
MTTTFAKSRSPSASARGFTLVELAIVVTIIGILATIGIYSVYKYIQHAKASEAAEIVGAIKAGQEAYYDETFQYLQVDSNSNSPEDYYPATPVAASGKIKIQWGQASVTGCEDCGTRYAALGVLPAAPVIFRYSCYVGAAGGNASTAAKPAAAVYNPNPFAAATSASQAFYVVNAVSDLDGDGGVMSVVVGSNLMGDLYSENIGR